ncbi:MAG: hypothetical protein MK161_16755 [Pirellulales bacterium]|nr:hypothetical protein [Pirellulales bacterium]
MPPTAGGAGRASNRGPLLSGKLAYRGPSGPFEAGATVAGPADCGGTTRLVAGEGDPLNDPTLVLYRGPSEFDGGVESNPVGDVEATCFPG